MKIMIDVTDNKARFIMELLHSFPYVTVQPATDEDKRFLNNSEDIVRNLPKQKQVKQLAKNEITISPFIMSMVAENPVPADYDYKTDYRNYLSEKYT
jgi:hypothetical protein